MKKHFAAVCAALITIIMCAAFFVGCGIQAPQEYIIQYTDDSGTHQITVTAGMPYSLDFIPTKTGYEFVGLYDEEEGGIQYVSSTGASLSTYKLGKNIVLFPQFKAKDYTVILDYQGAAVVGDRQFTVAYGSSMPELPKTLTGEHKSFAGWYTEKNCAGTQIADEYGLIPVVSVLNDTNFDLSGEYVYLYAGFEMEKFTVTCYFESGMDTENVEIEYDTPVSQTVPKTRINGKAPLTWSKTQDGEVFNGKITENMNLYAVEYAPVIELDSNGGSRVNAVVARAGSTISLPTPTKDMAKFAYWEDMQGNKYTSTKMPSNSISLKAVWQAKLVFDSNGGSEADDISVAAGDKITLPMPEREGFIFAGWYTADKDRYTSTIMPSVGVKLKAGWYKEKTDKIIMIDDINADSCMKRTSPSTSYFCYEFDYEKYFKNNETVTVKIDWHVKSKIDASGSYYVYVDFYTRKQVSSLYLLDTKSFDNITNSYREVNFSTVYSISDNFYLCWYTNYAYANNMYLKDFYYTVHYPDTTNLYL